MYGDKGSNNVSKQYVLELFSKTEDGKLDITYYPTNGEAPFELTYEIDWTQNDAETVAQRHESLVAMLKRFGQQHDELEDAESQEKLFTTEEVLVWNTYLSPFEAFEVEEIVIAEPYFRGEFDQLSGEKIDLSERHDEWQTNQCLKRLSFERGSPMNLVVAARHYEQLVRHNAPEVVLDDASRYIAEEMVLYYCSRKGAFYGVEGFYW